MTEQPGPVNGHDPQPVKPPKLTHAQQIGGAVAAALGAMLAQQLLPQVFQLLPQVLDQARPRRWCVTCLTTRLNWNSTHSAALLAAMAQVAEDAGLPEGDPRRAAVDPGPRLPPHLRPGSGTPQAMPGVNEWVTMAGGNLVCTQHLPGLEAAQGRRPLLIAHGSMSPAMLQQLGAPPV